MTTDTLDMRHSSPVPHLEAEPPLTYQVQVRGWDTDGWTPVEGETYPSRAEAEAGIRGLRIHTASILDAGETDDTEYRVVVV